MESEKCSTIGPSQSAMASHQLCHTAPDLPSATALAQPPPCAPVLPPPPLPCASHVSPPSYPIPQERCTEDVIKRMVQDNLQSILQGQAARSQDDKKVARDLIRRTLKLEWTYRDQCGDDLSADERCPGVVVVSWYNPVQPIIQRGPSCGLAALCMALHAISGQRFELLDVLNSARELGFTKQGEMFSAEDLLALARHLCPCEGILLNVSGESEATVGDNIVKELLQNSIVLIPYDRDFNNEPCLKRGHKAHWAAVTGLVYTRELTDLQSLRCAGAEITRDPEINNLFHQSPNKPHSVNLSQDGPSSLYIYALQGESAGPRLWSLESLVRSNGQLIELGPNISNNLQEYCIRCDITEGLRNKLVVLRNNKQIVDR